MHTQHILEDTQQNFEEKDVRNKEVVFQAIENGITLLKIDNVLATATVSLFGGQVIGWQPKTQAHPVLWRSACTEFSTTKPIRAGVPICWPWFGAHPDQRGMPSHGYARISAWMVDSIASKEDGSTELYLSMPPIQTDVNLAQIEALLRVKITISDILTIELITTNVGKTPIIYTEALHAYFTVSDIAQIHINGLNDCQYVDLIDNNTLKTQNDVVQFTQELGRVYVDTSAACTIHDPGLARVIHIEKYGSQSTVVWNPWLETASNMPDLGPDAWRLMVCVESANALKNTVCLQPGEQQAMRVVYAVKADSAPLL